MMNRSRVMLLNAASLVSVSLDWALKEGDGHDLTHAGILDGKKSLKLGSILKGQFWRGRNASVG